LDRAAAKDESSPFTVEDDGCGIPDVDLGRVLDPFFSSRLEAGGTGLGLSVAHGIAQEHGGNIAIESEVTESRRRNQYEAGTRAGENERSKVEARCGSGPMQTTRIDLAIRGEQSTASGGNRRSLTTRRHGVRNAGSR
jgi:signal transduction histidine kinase